MSSKNKTKNDKFTIRYVNYGIASRFPGYEIDINRALLEPKYKKLLKDIIEHEKSHLEGSNRFRDMFLDIKGIKNRRLYNQFILTHPSSLIQVIPIGRRKGIWFYDINLIIFWIFDLCFLYLINWGLVSLWKIII